MVAGAGAPRVVSQVVIVPSRDERVSSVTGLKVGVGPVEAMPDPVVLQSDYLPARLGCPNIALGRAKFIYVIAQM